MIKYIWFILEEALAVGIAILSFISLTHNHVGQTIINFSAALMLCLRLSNIIAFYRFYIDQSCFQGFATFAAAFLLSLGKLFENYNPTPSNNYNFFNSSCYIFVICILCLNLLYYSLATLAVIAHAGRQLYKLARGTILSSSASLLQQQLRILRKSFKPFSQLAEYHSIINTQCSICLFPFQAQQECIQLPGCNHIFHSECIDEWLTSKSNCPYCRSNIRLEILRA